MFGMGEGSHRAGLLLEAAAAFRIGRRFDGQDLDGDVPAQARVPGLVDLSHPARADGRKDLVRAESRAGREHHVASRSGRRRRV